MTVTLICHKSNPIRKLITKDFSGAHSVCPHFYVSCWHINGPVLYNRDLCQERLN